MKSELRTLFLHITVYQDFINANHSLRKPKINNLEIVQLTTIDTEFYRYLYNSVGKDYHWKDRNALSDNDLYHILERSTLYVSYVGGVPAGYIELAPESVVDGVRSVEVAYFGLRKGFLGQGLGGYLLWYGVDQAWQGGTERVWVHTCNLDGEHALTNYQKRGFVIFHETREPLLPEHFRDDVPKP